MEIALKKIRRDESGRRHTENGDLKAFELRDGDYGEILREMARLDGELRDEKYAE